jgi:hypothetical protein
MATKHKKFSIWAKKRLIDSELTVTELASLIGYPRQTVSAAVNGSERFPYVTAAIANILKHDSKTDSPLPSRPSRPEQRFRITAA